MKLKFLEILLSFNAVGLCVTADPTHSFTQSPQILHTLNYSIVCINYVGFIFYIVLKNIKSLALL